MRGKKLLKLFRTHLFIDSLIAIIPVLVVGDFSPLSIGVAIFDEVIVIIFALLIRK